jgi:hypothetical protein
MTMLTKEFVLAGQSIFTLELEEGYRESWELPPHYTFKVTKKDANGKFKTTWFVSLLTGPDNTKNYTYMGILDPQNGTVRTTEKSKFDNNSLIVRLLNRTLANMWAGTLNKLEDAGFRVHHEGMCGRCGRLLTVPESIETGIGPECRKHL